MKVDKLYRHAPIFESGANRERIRCRNPTHTNAVQRVAVEVLYSAGYLSS